MRTSNFPDSMGKSCLFSDFLLPKQQEATTGAANGHAETSDKAHLGPWVG